jgi:hypothetical protein
MEQSDQKWKKILIWIAVIVFTASIAGVGVYYWQKIEFDKLKNYSQRQIETLNQQISDIKSRCTDYSENAGKPLPGQCGQKPECPKMIFLEPGNCSGYASPMLVKLGKAKSEMVNIEKIVGENELGEDKKIKGNLCRSSVTFQGINEAGEKEIADKIKSDGWIEIGNANNASGMNRYDYSKGSELLILEIGHEPKGGWGGEFAKKKKETCDLPELQCFKNNEITSLVSLSVGAGFEN